MTSGIYSTRRSEGVRPHQTELWTCNFPCCRRLLLGNKWPTPSISAGVKCKCFSSLFFYELWLAIFYWCTVSFESQWDFLWARTLSKERKWGCVRRSNGPFCGAPGGQWQWGDAMWGRRGEILWDRQGYSRSGEGRICMLPEPMWKSPARLYGRGRERSSIFNHASYCILFSAA